MEKHLRELRDLPRKRIAELRDGERGKVVGRARVLDEHLIAPLSGQRCVFYVAEAMLLRKLLGDDKTLVREARAVLFVLEDDSGHAIIDPMGAQIALVTHYSSSDAFHPQTPAQREFLTSRDADVYGSFFDPSLHYGETVIAEDATIAILGAGTREPDPDAPPPAEYRGEPPTRLLLTSSPEYPLLISDDPGVLD